jgi:hypothetical protein
MAAPKGNRFWKMRAKSGRNKKYTPRTLATACEEYFEWAHTHPLHTVELVKFQGKATKVEVPRMRAFTKSGLCLFLGIDAKTWDAYREDKDFLPVTTRAEEIMFTQKFEGAAADLLNANIIARDLGLVDKKALGGSIAILDADDNDL